jgi:hypothetical protein
VVESALKVRSVQFAMPMRLLVVLSAFLTLACLGGWGRDGHAIIAEIAWREMTPAAQERARQILAGQDLPAVATWADQVRRTEAYRWTAPMHYVNLPADSASYDHAAHCPDEGCVVSAVDDFARLLLDEVDDKTREDALKFLIHFVGDLHQPLHAGRPGDRGGNDVAVRFNARQTNLHSLWDSTILAAGDPQPWPLIAERLHTEIDASDRLAWLADARPDDLLGTAGRWVFESHRLAERFAYPVHNGAAVGEAYVEMTTPVVHLRLKQGGVRLGALLNQLLDPASPGMAPRAEPVLPPPADAS